MTWVILGSAGVGGIVAGRSAYAAANGRAPAAILDFLEHGLFSPRVGNDESIAIFHFSRCCLWCAGVLPVDDAAQRRISADRNRNGTDEIVSRWCRASGKLLVDEVLR